MFYVETCREKRKQEFWKCLNNISMLLCHGRCSLLHNVCVALYTCRFGRTMAWSKLYLASFDKMVGGGVGSPGKNKASVSLLVHVSDSENDSWGGIYRITEY